MEQILENLLVPDSETIKSATGQLKTRFKTPEATQELCACLASSGNPQVRQYSAVLLKRKLASSSFPEPIKNGLLETLSKESERSVAKSIAILMAMGTKKGPWPELSAFIESGLNESPAQTLWLISVLSEVSPEFIPLGHLAPRLKDSLGNPENGFYALKTLTNVLPSASQDLIPVIQPMIPSILEFISNLAPTDGQRTAEALDILDELLESEIPFASPFIAPMCNLCISLASQHKLDESLRVKAISFLGRIVRYKKKTVVKQKLYVPMINTLFPIMCTLEEDDDLYDDEDEQSPEVTASQTLDVLAVNLPPAKFMNTLMLSVKPALETPERPDLLKGALTAISVSAEGCAEHIRAHYLTYFLNCIGSAITSPSTHPAVKSAAFYALGQMSEYLQPEISRFSGEILPVLFGVLDKVISDVLEGGAEESQKGLDRVFYALEEFCENMEEDLIPVLPELMRRLITLINPKFRVSTREVVMSAIAAAASAVKEAIVPYFETIMGILKGYLVYKEEDQDAQNLLTQSMYTLGVIARSVAETGAFGSALAQECVTLGINLITAHDDPDVRKSAYALFASVAYVVKEEMAPVLPPIVERMLKSLQSMEELALEFNEEEELFQELEDDEEEVDLSLDAVSDETKRAFESIKAVSVENAFMDEKEQAILAFRDLVKYVGPEAFRPYLPELTEEVFSLLDFPFETIRQAAAGTMPTLVFVAPELDKALSLLVNKLCRMVTEDEEVPVVCSALEALSEILKGDSAPLRAQPELIQAIANCVRNVMNQSNIACIDTEGNGLEDQMEEEEEEDAEQEEMLFEYAGDVLPSLGRALDPQTFAGIFAELFPLFLKKTKASCSNAEKSFAVGSLAECMEPLQGTLEPFAERLYAAYAAMSQEENEDVRNNAVFGLGEMALHGGAPIFPLFPQILTLLSGILGHKETTPRIRDQVVGAVCRLILSNASLLPLNEIYPVIIQNLPLKEDHDEFLYVYRSTLYLMQNKESSNLIKEHLKTLLHASVTIDPKKAGEVSKLEAGVVEFWQAASREYASEFNASLQTMDPATASKISQSLSK